MIKFTKLIYKNILACGDFPITIDLAAKTRTLITGANGAGKTTILTALCFVLFGKDFGKKNNPQLINSINKKNLLVEVHFETKGKEYVIKRGMKPKVFEIWIDGKLRPSTPGGKNGDDQKFLENNILGMNYNAFKQIVAIGAGSGGYVPFMQQPAGARREIVEVLLDLVIFSKMNLVLRDDIAKTKEDIEGIEKLLTLEMEKRKILDKSLTGLKKDQQSRHNNIQEQIDKLMDENEVNSDLLTQKLTRMKELQTKQKKVNEVEKHRVAVATKLMGAKTRQADLEKRNSFFHSTDTCPTCTQSISPEFKNTVFEGLAKELDAIDVEKSELETNLEKITKAITLNAKINDQLGEVTMEVSRIQSSIHANTKLIDSLLARMEEETASTDKLDEIEAQIDKIDGRILKLNVGKSKLLRDRELQNISFMLLKDNGIKSKIINTYIPLINRLVNEYLATMDFYVSFELDENFNETIKSRYRDEFTYESFSLGQKQRIDTALLFTWRDVAKVKNNMSTNILFLDETLDTHLDDAGVDDLMKILYSLTDTNLFVISPKSSMIDKFDRTLQFSLANNFSIMEEI